MCTFHVTILAYDKGVKDFYAEASRNRMGNATLLPLNLPPLPQSSTRSLYMTLFDASSFGSRCPWKCCISPSYLLNDNDALLEFAGWTLLCLGTLGLWRLASCVVGIGHWPAGYILSLLS